MSFLFFHLEGTDRPATASSESPTPKSAASKSKDKGRGKSGGKRPPSRSKESKGNKGAAEPPSVPSTPVAQLASKNGEEPKKPKEAKVYTIIGRLLSDVPPVSSLSSTATATPARGSAKGKKPKSASKEVSGPQWSLRIFNEQPEFIKIAESRTREQEIENIKLGWEAVQEGRCEAAKASREKFLSSDVVGDNRDEEDGKSLSSDTSENKDEESKNFIKIFDDATRLLSEKRRAEEQRQHKLNREALRERRARDKAIRLQAASSEYETACTLRQDWVEQLGDRNSLRKIYRDKLVAEENRLRAIEEARLAKIKAEEEAAAAAAGGKKKKKKK